MKISIALRTAILVGIVGSSSAMQTKTACSKCDCSHFPINGDDCVKCCFYQKGTVTSVSDNTVTIAPILPASKEPTTFQIQKRTKINGELRQGANATVYYHRTDGRNVATRIDGLGFYRGFLVPANLPGPPDPCAEVRKRLQLSAPPGVPIPPPVPAEAMRVFLGNSEVHSMEHRLVVLKVGNEEALVLQETEGLMSASAILRDADGHVEAIIVDNEFFLNPNDAFQIIGTGTSTLVVRNKRGETILDVQFFNPHVVKILGTFFGPEGEKITINEEQQTFESRTGARFESSHDCIGGSSIGTIDLTATGPILVR